MTEAGLEQLGPLESLEELRLYLGTPVTDIGAAYLAKIKSLRRITDSLQVTDKGIALIASLPNLEWVEFYGPKVTDEGVKHIGGVKSLKWLWLQECPVTDDGLAALADMPNLELLRVLRTHASGEGFKYLRGSPKLALLGVDFGNRNEQPPDFHPTLDDIAKLDQVTWLEINGHGLSNSDLQAVSQMRQLNKLLIEDEFSVNDEGAKAIAALSNLDELSIRKGSITDEGLKEIAKLSHLQVLQLEGKFTDDGIKSLVDLRLLKILYLGSPNVTPAGISALEKQLPALQLGQ